MSNLTPTRSNIDRVTNIRVLVNGIEIGSIQSFNVSESKEITSHFTLNGINITEPKLLVEGIVKSKTLTCSYFALWKKNVLSAFGAPASSDPIITLSNQDSLFTVEEVISNSGNAEDKIVRWYEDCYISDYGATRDIGRGDVRILEIATIVYTRVVTSLTD